MEINIEYMQLLFYIHTIIPNIEQYETKITAPLNVNDVYNIEFVFSSDCFRKYQG